MFKQIFNVVKTPLTRNFSTFSKPTYAKKFIMAGSALGATGFALSSSVFAASDEVDYKKVRGEIADILDAPNWDDGSLGPVFVRLAWHASGTYSKEDGSGGSDGATMRFNPEAAHGANAGLHHARNVLEKVKEKYPGISYADLWILAGVTAIEEMGGPTIGFTPGRTDKPDGSFCTPDGRLPDAAQGAQHLRDIFYRMGFNDQEIVALAGAHALGRCHTDRSGFSGPWTRSPTTFSNTYFTELLNNTWTEKKWNGPKQYEDPTGDLMMLPSDMCLLDDASFKRWVKIYAKDGDRFDADFAKAFRKLTELGCTFPNSQYTPLVFVSTLAALALCK
jgi:cytochrome c peroxidase